MPDFSRVPDDVAATLRARLAQRGVRKLVEFDTKTAQEREDAYGKCHIHHTPIASRRTIWLDDDNHHVHAVHEAACPLCDSETP